MSAFKGRLKPAQIADIAAFVYKDRNPKKAPKTTTTTTTTSTTSTTPATTTSSAPATTTTSAPPPATTTTGGVTSDGCPAGQTIVTSGNTDNDGDEGGAPSDMDGCI
jgi:hypothetical protein